METRDVNLIPVQLRSLYCTVNMPYKSSSATRKFNCKCPSCKKWNTLRNFYRKNTNEKYRNSQKKSTSKWKKNHLEYGRRSEAKRRSVYSEKYTEAQVLDLYGNACHICNNQIDLLADRSPGKVGWEYSLHIDHVVPVSKGGFDTLQNVRPAHGICNVKKGAR